MGRKYTKRSTTNSVSPNQLQCQTNYERTSAGKMIWGDAAFDRMWYGAIKAVQAINKAKIFALVFLFERLHLSKINNGTHQRVNFDEKLTVNRIATVSVENCERCKELEYSIKEATLPIRTLLTMYQSMVNKNVNKNVNKAEMFLEGLIYDKYTKTLYLETSTWGPQPDSGSKISYQYARK